MESITRLTLGALASNCYIIPSGDSAVVIDPASSAEVMAALDAENMTLGGIVITHGHFDHFAGAAALKAQTGAEIYVPDLDEEMFGSSQKSWAWFMQGTEFEPPEVDYIFSDGDEFTLCGIPFRVMAAPGHTAGSCLLFCERFGVIFSGDVLFQGSIGRTDGFSGSDRMMAESLKKIAGINGNYQILPGHGDATNLDNEKRYNPYLSQYC